MAIQLGSAYGKVALDVAGLLSGVIKGKAALLNLANIGTQVGGAMKNIGNMMTVGLTLPILAVGAASIKAASNFEETKNKAIVVFEEMADSVVSNSNRAASSLGISKTQYLDYASSIGAALKAGGMTIVEATELSEQAVKHFADLASFHNTQVEDAALAWQSAIRGQFEPIQKYFPFITNQYLITYGTANGLIDANTKQLTANQRAIILNAIALDDKLNPALNDFAETSKGLANQGRILKAQWQDALVLLGQNLLPIALKVVSSLNAMLEAFNKLSPTQQKILLGFLALVAIAGPLLSALGTIIAIVSSLAGLATTLSGMGITLGTIGTVITGTLIPAIGAILTALAPLLIILAAVALYVGILYIMWRTNFLGMRDNVTLFVKVVKALWQALLAFLRGDTQAALEHLGEAFDAFRERIAKIFSSFAGFQQAWANFMNFVRTAMTNLVNYISKSFTNINWSQVGRFILLGIANGMLLGLPALITTAARVATSVLAQIKRSLGIRSPSSEAFKLGDMTAQGYILGMQKAMDPNAIANLLTRPVTQNNNASQQNITMQFASGLTIRQVQGMIAENNEQLMSTLSGALGGA